jgi:hypothetical protein
MTLKEIVIAMVATVVVGTLFVALALSTAPAPSEQSVRNRAVCFSTNKNIQLNMEDYNIEIVGNSLQWSNGEGRYIYTLPDGYMCSVVPALSEKGAKE